MDVGERFGRHPPRPAAGLRRYHWRRDAKTSKNIAIEPDVLERVELLAEIDGKTADQVVNDATKRELARRWLERVGQEARVRRGNMTDEEVEAEVDQAIQSHRAEQRGR